MKVLLNEKYIIRVMDKNYMRNWIIFPSKRGEGIYRTLKKYTEDYENQIIEGIDKNEIIILSEILDKIKDNLP